MANHSSATLREQTPHVNQLSRTNTIMNALKRRAQVVLNDKSIDAQSRAMQRIQNAVVSKKEMPYVETAESFLTLRSSRRQQIPIPAGQVL